MLSKNGTLLALVIMSYASKGIDKLDKSDFSFLICPLEKLPFPPINQCCSFLRTNWIKTFYNVWLEIRASKRDGNKLAFLTSKKFLLVESSGVSVIEQQGGIVAALDGQWK